MEESEELHIPTNLPLTSQYLLKMVGPRANRDGMNECIRGEPQYSDPCTVTFNDILISPSSVLPFENPDAMEKRRFSSPAW
jgi:hypothetical protein